MVFIRSAMLHLGDDSFNEPWSFLHQSFLQFRCEGLRPACVIYGLLMTQDVRFPPNSGRVASLPKESVKCHLADKPITGRC